MPNAQGDGDLATTVHSRDQPEVYLAILSDSRVARVGVRTNCGCVTDSVMVFASRLPMIAGEVSSEDWT
jgi:hypothetical protein